MFEPVSALPYHRLSADRQILVVTAKEPDNFAETWKDRAVAVLRFTAESDPVALVRDLLANPSVRVVVFLDNGPGIARLRRFWAGKEELPTGHGIKPWHVNLVRQWVDPYEGDAAIHTVLQPFWPERILYKET